MDGGWLVDKGALKRVQGFCCLFGFAIRDFCVSVFKGRAGAESRDHVC
jgi:hypothetical protein